MVYQKPSHRRGVHASAADEESASVDKGGVVRLLAADLLLPDTIDMLLNVIRDRRWCYIHGGIECSFFSVLRIMGGGRCPSRSKTNPG